MDPDDRIINASDEVVRKALIAICGDHSIERKALQVIQQLERHIAEEEIMKQQQQQQQQRDDDDNAAAARTTADGSLANKKRKAAREVHVCVQCKETFTEEENDERACCYHSGELTYLDKLSNPPPPISPTSNVASCVWVCVCVCHC